MKQERVSRKKSTLPITQLQEETQGKDKVPVFRAFPPNKIFEIENRTQKNIDANTIDTIGINTSKRILPYKEQSKYECYPTETETLHVCIENDILKASILPEWGGRLLSLYDKVRQEEIIYNPKQIILRNLAIRNAWFAGGIEWNIGYLGHAPHTASPVGCAKITVDKGEEGIRIYSYERISKLWWQIDFLLPEHSSVLEVVVSVYNDEDVDKDLYWWTNIAVAEELGVRVLTSSSTCLWRSSIDKGFEYVDFPHPYNNKEIDYSYSTNYPQASEFFFNAPQEKILPWISSVDKEGRAFFEISSKGLGYRKVFCWGMHQGGRNWQRLLHQNRASDYYEIQAGIAPSQLHSATIKAREKISWTHYMGRISLDGEHVHTSKWKEASDYVYKNIYNSVKNNIRKDSEYEDIANANIEKIFSSGEKFCELELYNKHNSILPSWLLDTIDKQSTSTQARKPANPTNSMHNRWRELLASKQWKEYSKDETIEWTLDERHQSALEALLSDNKGDWSIYVHLGVMYREKFDFNRAIECFKQSIALKANQFAYWGLINCADVYKNVHEVKRWIRESIACLRDADLKYHILQLCVDYQFWDIATRIMDGLSKEELADKKLLPISIKIEIHKKNFDRALALFQTEDHYIREGDIDFVDTWNTIMKGLKDTKNAKYRELPPGFDYRMSLL